MSNKPSSSDEIKDPYPRMNHLPSPSTSSEKDVSDYTSGLLKKRKNATPSEQIDGEVKAEEGSPAKKKKVKTTKRIKLRTKRLNGKDRALTPSSNGKDNALEPWMNGKGSLHIAITKQQQEIEDLHEKLRKQDTELPEKLRQGKLEEEQRAIFAKQQLEIKDLQEKFRRREVGILHEKLRQEQLEEEQRRQEIQTRLDATEAQIREDKLEEERIRQGTEARIADLEAQIRQERLDGQQRQQVVGGRIVAAESQMRQSKSEEEQSQKEYEARITTIESQILDLTQPEAASPLVQQVEAEATASPKGTIGQSEALGELELTPSPKMEASSAVSTPSHTSSPTKAELPSQPQPQPGLIPSPDIEAPAPEAVSTPSHMPDIEEAELPPQPPPQPVLTPTPIIEGPAAVNTVSHTPGPKESELLTEPQSQSARHDDAVAVSTDADSNQHDSNQYEDQVSEVRIYKYGWSSGNGEKLLKSISELVKDCDHVPLIDVEAFVNRSVEEREEEMETRKQRIEPKSAVSLYEKAYMNRVWSWRTRNRMYYTSASFWSKGFSLESREFREKFEQLALIDLANQDKAHPDFKYAPPIAGKCPKKEVDLSTLGVHYCSDCELIWLIGIGGTGAGKSHPSHHTRPSEYSRSLMVFTDYTSGTNKTRVTHFGPNSKYNRKVPGNNYILTSQPREEDIVFGDIKDLLNMVRTRILPEQKNLVRATKVSQPQDLSSRVNDMTKTRLVIVTTCWEVVKGMSAHFEVWRERGTKNFDRRIMTSSSTKKEILEVKEGVRKLEEESVHVVFLLITKKTMTQRGFHRTDYRPTEIATNPATKRQHKTSIRRQVYCISTFQKAESIDSVLEIELLRMEFQFELPAPTPKRRSTKLESDNEEFDSSQLWREQQRSAGSPPKKKKRGPGRPRKPDHELARPRRPSTAKLLPKPHKEELEDTGPRDAVSNTKKSTTRRATLNDITPRKRGAVLIAPTKDQVTIASQRQQIESMQEKLRQYEARIKAMEARHGSTPPTPAMSIIQPSSHAHPLYPQNTPVMPSSKAQEADDQFDREDSPLSVYSDLWTPELLSTSGIHQRGGEISTSWDEANPLKNGKEKAETLIIKLKANPVIPYTRTSRSSPAKPTVREWENTSEEIKADGLEEKKEDRKRFPTTWFRAWQRE